MVAHLGEAVRHHAGELVDGDPFWLSPGRLRPNFVAAEPPGTEDHLQPDGNPKNVGSTGEAAAVNATSREEIRGWVQTSAIIIAGAWAAWTFIFKEIYEPQSAPINITMELHLERIHLKEIDDSNSGSIFPIEIKIAATNPSTRPIYLLSSAWWARGLNVERHKTDKTEFEESVVRALNYPSGEYAERYTNMTDESLVAAGSLFSNRDPKSGGTISLKPNEKISRTLIIYLPPRFDKLEVIIKIPAAGRDPEGKLELLWDRSRQYTLYRNNQNGKRTSVLDKNLKELVQEFELQFSEATSETSLRE